LKDSPLSGKLSLFLVTCSNVPRTLLQKSISELVCPCKLNGKTVSALSGLSYVLFSRKVPFHSVGPCIYEQAGHVVVFPSCLKGFYRPSSAHFSLYSPLLFLPCHQPSSQQESRLCVLLKGSCPSEIQGSKYLIPAKKVNKNRHLVLKEKKSKNVKKKNI
jgi:hypothetical protein